MLCDRLTLKVRWTNEQFFEWMSQNIEFYCAVYSFILLINSFFIKYSSISHKIAATFLRSPLNTHKWSNQKWWNFFFCRLYQRMSPTFFLMLSKRTIAFKSEMWMRLDRWSIHDFGIFIDRQIPSSNSIVDPDIRSLNFSERENFADKSCFSRVHGLGQWKIGEMRLMFS